MTNPPEQESGRADPDLQVIMSERRRLISLAYRLLGSLAEAEDAVQETYARWYAMSRQQQDAIESPGAWLTTVASRICLDVLRSARSRRERYVGEWIPEPLPDRTEWITGQPVAASVDPADRVTLDESINMAFLVVLESMTPAERVALILHDVFRYSFAEVARSSAVPRRHVASLRPRPDAAFAPPRHRRRRSPSVQTSSRTSNWRGKPRTSTPSSPSSIQMPRLPPTAAGLPSRSCTPSKVASRSRTPGSRSPTGRPDR